MKILLVRPVPRPHASPVNEEELGLFSAHESRPSTQGVGFSLALAPQTSAQAYGEQPASEQKHLAI